MNEEYNKLVNSITDRLLEEGPEVGADNEGGASTPDSDEKRDVSPFATGAAVGGFSNTLIDVLRKAVGYRHFGGHAALRGDTSGTGED